MFNSKFGVGVLKHPGYNIGGGVGESLLLEQVIQGAIIGGGLSALTGGDFLTGALTGGIGGGVKSLIPFDKIFSGAANVPVDPGLKPIVSAGAQAYTPAAIGSSVATSPWTSEIVSATSPFGTAGTSGITNLAANAFPNVAPDTIQNAMLQNLANKGITSDVTQGVQPGNVVDKAPTAQPTYADVIQKNKLQPYGLSNAPTGTTTATGDYVLDGKLYKGSDILKAMSPQEQSFFQKYKWPLLIGGAGLGYKMLTDTPKMAYSPPPVSGGPLSKYNLAPNFAPVPNPTPVYPRFAEGGIAQLASGGNMGVDKVNVDFMGGDMFPMSQQPRSMYATPTQMPTSAQQALASYEPNINPLTGASVAHMASGGVARPNFQSAFEKLYAKEHNPIFGIMSLVPNENWNIESQTGSGAFGMPSSDFQASSVDPNTWNKQGYAKNTLTAEPMASGGISSLGGYSDGGRMLKGPGDGMSDSIPGVIANKRPARLADGEFVVPADVVSHLGNGSTDAGAKQLYAMMNRVRKARTGNPKQGKQINPRKLMTA